MWGRAALVGLVLGVLAYAADFCHGVLAVAMLLVSSSVFAWGAAALLAGFAARDRRAATVAAVTVLAVATLVYYGIILLDGDRWQGGEQADGSSYAPLGLRSVLRATAFWLAASVAGGVVLGLLAQAVRRARPGAAALAAGAAGALLAAQGAQRLSGVVRAGGIPSHYLAEAAPWLVEAVAEVGLAAGLSVALLRRGARPVRWGTFAAAVVALLVVALLAWQRVEAVRTTGF